MTRYKVVRGEVVRVDLTEAEREAREAWVADRLPSVVLPPDMEPDPVVSTPGPRLYTGNYL